ncbi:MAG: DUF2007 domain-containing protein [Blastocatellia bacterium]
MAFCPNCESEYRTGILICPDCNIELVAELTPETKLHDTSDADLVRFQSFSNSAQAEMVRETLEQNGVRAFVEGGDFALIPSSFSREVVVMVDERDLDQAIAIYEAYFNAESTAPADEDQTEKE